MKLAPTLALISTMFVLAAPTGCAEDGEKDTSAPEHVDLFECGAPEACEPIFAHLDPEPAEALQCAGKVVTSTAAGVIRGLDTPGPNIDETDYFVLSLGDGTALVQTRERHCDPEEESCDPEPSWEPSSAHQVCDLVLAEGLAAACASDPPEGSCVWYPMNGGYTNCVEVADYTCDEVLGLLP